MTTIQLAATFNINNIRVYTDYIEIPISTGSIKVKMVARVKPEHVVIAKEKMEDFFNNVKNDQCYKETIGHSIDKGMTIIKASTLQIEKDMYDVLISG